VIAEDYKFSVASWQCGRQRGN